MGLEGEDKGFDLDVVEQEKQELNHPRSIISSCSGLHTDTHTVWQFG